MTFGNHKFVAAAGQFMMSSIDGKNWLPHLSGASNALTAVTYGNGRFVAVGENTAAVTSEDGELWLPAHVST